MDRAPERLDHEPDRDPGVPVEPSLEGPLLEASRLRAAQARKLDALGALAGGVAHAFDHHLSAILMAAEQIGASLAPDSPARDRVEVIRAVCAKATELNGQILTFLRDEPGERGPSGLGEVVQEAASTSPAEALEAVLQRLRMERLARARKARLEATAQAVRQAHKVMVAAPEAGLPVYAIQEPLADAGGDVFRSVRRPGGRIQFLVADVAGHSVLSSYALASFLGTLSTFQAEDPRPGAFFRQLHQAILDGPFPEIPVAALGAEWCPATGRCHLVNAGIPYGLHLRKREGQCLPIPLNGAPLGLLEEPRMSERVLVLEPGDRLLFGTDGLFDAAGAHGVRFRELAPERWRALAGQPVAAALGALGEAVHSHAEGGLDDDLLAIALEQPEWAPGEDQFLRAIPSTLAAVETVCGGFETFLERLGAGERARALRFKAGLALREALSNAQRHGNQGRPSGRIGVIARLRAQALELSIVDDGPGFDPSPPRFVPEPGQESGRGLILLHEVASGLAVTGGELAMTIPLGGGSDGA